MIATLTRCLLTLLIAATVLAHARLIANLKLERSGRFDSTGLRRAIERREFAAREELAGARKTVLVVPPRYGIEIFRGHFDIARARVVPDSGGTPCGLAGQRW